MLKQMIIRNRQLEAELEKKDQIIQTMGYQLSHLQNRVIRLEDRNVMFQHWLEWFAYLCFINSRSFMLIIYIGNGAGITNRILLFFLHLLRLWIFYKLCLDLQLRIFNYFQQNEKNMSSADSITTWVDIAVEFFEVVILNMVHPFTV